MVFQDFKLCYQINSSKLQSSQQGFKTNCLQLFHLVFCEIMEREESELLILSFINLCSHLLYCEKNLFTVTCKHEYGCAGWSRQVQFVFKWMQGCSFSVPVVWPWPWAWELKSYIWLYWHTIWLGCNFYFCEVSSDNLISQQWWSHNLTSDP